LATSINELVDRQQNALRRIGEAITQQTFETANRLLRQAFFKELDCTANVRLAKTTIYGIPEFNIHVQDLKGITSVSTTIAQIAAPYVSPEKRQSNLRIIPSSSWCWQRGVHVNTRIVRQESRP
jgi:hypothetical protein